MNEVVLANELRNVTCSSNNEVIAPKENPTNPEIPTNIPVIEKIDKEKIRKVEESIVSNGEGRSISPVKICDEVKNSSESNSRCYESISPYLSENNKPPSPFLLNHHSSVLNSKKGLDLETETSTTPPHSSNLELDQCNNNTNKLNFNPSHQSDQTQIRVRKNSTEDRNTNSSGRKIRLPDKKQSEKGRTLKEFGIPVGIAVAWQRNASVSEIETTSATESTTTAITPTLHRSKNTQYQSCTRLTNPNTMSSSSTSPSKSKRSSSSSTSASSSKLKPTTTINFPSIESKSIGNGNGKTNHNHVTTGNSLETIDSPLRKPTEKDGKSQEVPPISTTCATAVFSSSSPSTTTSLVNEVLKIGKGTCNKSRLPTDGNGKSHPLDSNSSPGNGYTYNNNNTNFGLVSSGSNSPYQHHQPQHQQHHRDWPPHLLHVPPHHAISSGAGSPAFMQMQSNHMHSQLPMQLMTNPYGPYSLPPYMYPGYSTTSNPLLHYEQLLQQQQHQQHSAEHQRRNPLEFDYRQREITPISSPRISIPSPSPTSQLNSSSVSFNLESHHQPTWISDLYHHQMSLCNTSSTTLSPRSLASSTPSPITIHDTNSYFLNRKCITPNPIPTSKHYPFSSPFSPSIKPSKDTWKEQLYSPLSLVTHSRKPSMSPVAEEDGNLEYEFNKNSSNNPTNTNPNNKNKQNDFRKLESLIEKRDDKGSSYRSSSPLAGERKRKLDPGNDDLVELKPKAKVQKLYTNHTNNLKCAEKCDGNEMTVPESNNNKKIFSLSENSNAKMKSESKRKHELQQLQDKSNKKKDKSIKMPKKSMDSSNILSLSMLHPHPSEIKNGKLNNSHNPNVPFPNEICTTNNISPSNNNRPETEVRNVNNAATVNQVQALQLRDASSTAPAYNCDRDSNKRADNNNLSAKNEYNRRYESFLPTNNTKLLPSENVAATTSTTGLVHSFPKIVISEEESHLNLLATVAQEIGPYISINSEASRTLRLENLTNMIEIQKSPERSVSNSEHHHHTHPSNDTTSTTWNNITPICNPIQDNKTTACDVERKTIEEKSTEQHLNEQPFQLKIPQIHPRKKADKESRPKRRLSLEKKPPKKLKSERRNSLDGKKSRPRALSHDTSKSMTKHTSSLKTPISSTKLKSCKKYTSKKSDEPVMQLLQLAKPQPERIISSPTNKIKMSMNENESKASIPESSSVNTKPASSVYDFDFEDNKLTPSVPPFKQYSSEKFGQITNNSVTSHHNHSSVPLINNNHTNSNLSHVKPEPANTKIMGKPKKADVGLKDLKVETFIPKTCNKQLQHERPNLKITTSINPNKPISKVKPTRILTHTPIQNNNLTKIPTPASTTLAGADTLLRSSKVESTKNVTVATNGMQKINNEQIQNLPASQSVSPMQSNFSGIFPTPASRPSANSVMKTNLTSFHNTDSNTYDSMSNDSCSSTWITNPALAVTAVKVVGIPTTDLNKREVPEQPIKSKDKDASAKTPKKHHHQLSLQQKSRKSKSSLDLYSKVSTSSGDEKVVKKQRARNRSEGSAPSPTIKSPLKIRKRQNSIHHIKPSLKAEPVVKSADENSNSDSESEDLLDFNPKSTSMNNNNKVERLKIRKPSIDMNIFSRRHKSTDEKDDITKELEWNDNVVISGVEEMIDEMRVLTEIQGLFYTGKLNALQPPDVYGVTLDNERGAPPHMIFSAEQVLEKCIREAKPWKSSQLPHGLRICAYWSPMYSGLYAGKVSTDYDTKSELVPVEFDDGDTGVIKIGEIRLLAPNHPVREYDPNPLLTLEKKHRKRRNSSANTQNSCNGDHDEPDCGEAYCAKIAKLQDDESEEDDEEVITEPETEEHRHDQDYSSTTSNSSKVRYWTWSGLGYKRPKSKKNRHKEFFHGIQRGDEIINVGDAAIFISNERNERPFLGRVENFWEKKGHKIVNVRWFYHPEEVKTKKKIHGLKYPGALFESPHIDENDVQTIARKCEVLQYDEFKEKYGNYFNTCSKVGKLQGSPTTLKKSKSPVKGVYYVAGFYDPYNFKLKMNDLK